MVGSQYNILSRRFFVFEGSHVINEAGKVGIGNEISENRPDGVVVRENEQRHLLLVLLLIIFIVYLLVLVVVEL